MQRRSRRRVALAASTVSLIAAGPLIAAETAVADYPYPPHHGLRLDSVDLCAGDVVDFVGTGYEANEETRATLVSTGRGGSGTDGPSGQTAPRGSAAFPQPLEGAPSSDGSDGEGQVIVLGTQDADEDGRVEGTVTIPRSVRPGSYWFVLEGLESHLRQKVRVHIGECKGHDGHDRPGHGDEDHDRPGQGDEDHDRPVNGGEEGDHDRPGYSDGGNDSSSSDASSSDDGPSLATTGDSGVNMTMLGVAGGLVVLGGGSVLLLRRQRSTRQQD